MIFGILKDGVRSACVRIVRMFVYVILIILIIYLIGLFTDKKNENKKGSGINASEILEIF